MRRPEKSVVCRVLVLCLVAMNLGCALQEDRAGAVPGNAYLGLPPPGLEPEIFAPGRISLEDEYEFGSVFSADGLEFFYGVDLGGRSEIRTLKFEAGAWSEPRVLLADSTCSFNDPFLSPDERRLYFISERPGPGRSEAAADMDIWFIERESEDWSEPVTVGQPINTAADEYYVSFSLGGALYYASNFEASQERPKNFDIYVARPSLDGYQAPELLQGDINSTGYEADAFVAPDESYIIFSSSRRSGLGQGDLYISHRRSDGSWSAAKNLGELINTKGHELCPFVTKDGRFFFYTSNQDIFWVAAEVLGAH